MVTGAIGADGTGAIRRVNDTLQGPVVDILSQFLPEIRRMRREQAYERTLDDIALLDRCFRVFRAEPDQFRSVMLDKDRQPVTDGRTPLSCGRTLDEVVAMIVRTAAKRYFRRKLNPKGPHVPLTRRFHNGKPTVHREGLVHRVQALLTGKPVKAVHSPATHARADELYDALKANLLHDWQVPLVPCYAEMTPRMAIELGAKLLDIREEAHLRRVINDPEEAAKLFDAGTEAIASTPRPPCAPGQVPARDERARLSEILTPDGARLRAEAFTGVVLKPELRRLLKNGDQLLKANEMLRGVGGIPAKLLVAELGLRMDQMAAILLTAHETIGPDMFLRVFGQPGDAKVVMSFTQKAREAGIDQKSGLEDCSAVVRTLFARMRPVPA